MVELHPMHPGAFENDPEADDLWSFSVAATSNIKLLKENIDGLQSEKYTVLYPNGTVSSPGILRNGQRIVVPNPFLDKRVKCYVEVLTGNYWGETGFIFIDSVSQGMGVSAYQIMSKDNTENWIVIQAGSAGLVGLSNAQGNPFEAPIGALTDLPFRLIVVCY